MQVREVADIREISSREWAGLVARSPDATVFQAYEWLSAWWESFAENGSRSRILVVYRDNDLVGALPLYEVGNRPESEARRLLKLIGSEHADYQCALSAEAGVLAHLLVAAIKFSDSRYELLLEELPQFSSMELHLAERTVSSHGSVVRGALTPCPRLRLQGNEEGVEAVLRKQSLRRHVKRLATQGSFEVRHIVDPQEIRHHLPIFFEQHVERWRSTSFPSLFEKPGNRRFYECMTDRLGGMAQVLMSVLELNGVPVAYHFGLLSGRDLLWYKPTFDVRLMACSPGEILLKHLIEHASEQGYAAVDFTRGDEAYKNRFASEVRYNSSYLITARRWHRRSIALQAGLRQLLRRGDNLADGGKVVLGGAIAS